MKKGCPCERCSRTERVVAAARAVAKRWRVLIERVYLESATRAELEELLDAVGAHPEAVPEAVALDPARLPQPSGDLPWRVGRRIPIHLYDGKGHPLGTMLTVADARHVVSAVNTYEGMRKRLGRGT